jgi:hypothetical protein
MKKVKRKGEKKIRNENKKKVKRRGGNEWK